jgi:cation transport ATPase
MKQPISLKIYLLILLILSACIKLQEKNIKLDVNCPKCAQSLLDTLHQMKGVHYATYNQLDSSLVVKYDTTGFSMRKLNNLLIEEGYVRFSQDSIRKVPKCCK